MGFSFDNFSERGGYLRQAGLHTGATFKGLTYTANENWEGFDIEFETADGKMFRERTFGADINKSFPRDKWENGQKVGKETVQEAYERVQEEISKKLYYLGLAFVPAAELKEAVRGAKDLKSLVERVAKTIGSNADKKVNFLTIWKNSDAKQKSNLILADKTRWIEATKFDGEKALPAGIALSKYQQENNTVEKYPYKGNNETVDSTSSYVGDNPVDDLPF